MPSRPWAKPGQGARRRSVSHLTLSSGIPPFKGGGGGERDLEIVFGVGKFLRRFVDTFGKKQGAERRCFSSSVS